MKYAMIAAYSFTRNGRFYARNEIMSIHSTYALARKACVRFDDSLTAVAEVSDKAQRGIRINAATGF